MILILGKLPKKVVDNNSILCYTSARIEKRCENNTNLQPGLNKRL
jgi:hypothetical protein